MIGSEIISRFELWTDDSTELSSDEELFLANQKIRLIYSENQWEFLRKTASGSFSGGFIDVSAMDFDRFMANYVDDPTCGSMPDTIVVYVNNNPYKVIPMGSRFNQSGVAYYDSVNKKIMILGDASGTYEFDYKHKPVDILTSTAPIFDDQFHLMVVYAMLIDDEIIQKVEKARANFTENSAQFQRIMSNLKSHDSKLVLM